jgi:alkylhydroperoxidase family enzyme
MRQTVKARSWQRQRWTTRGFGVPLTEAATRISDRADPVPDEIWEEAARHYREQALAALVLNIAQINVWNRLNVTTRQVAGQEC